MGNPASTALNLVHALLISAMFKRLLEPFKAEDTTASQELLGFPSHYATRQIAAGEMTSRHAY
jgi:hypothetical protein